MHHIVFFVLSFHCFFYCAEAEYAELSQCRLIRYQVFWYKAAMWNEFFLIYVLLCRNCEKNHIYIIRYRLAKRGHILWFISK